MATSTLDMNTNMWAYPIFMGFGLGWTLTYLVTAAQMSAPAHLIATISGILLAIRSFGASIALGICKFGHFLYSNKTNIQQIMPSSTPLYQRA